MHWVDRACRLVPAITGRRRHARTEMVAMTTSSSNNENAFAFAVTRLDNAFGILWANCVPLTVDYGERIMAISTGNCQ